MHDFPLPLNRNAARLFAALASLALCAFGAQAQTPVRRTPGMAAFVKALDLVPENAAGLLVVPSAQALAEDMNELAAKLERMQALTQMKPLDLLKSQIGVGPGMNDRGTFAAWFAAAGKSPQWCALIPTTDAAQFLQANLEAAPDVAPDAFRRKGKTFYARSVDGYVVVSESEDLARSYASKAGMAQRLRTRLGERGFALLCDGDIGAWAGPEALASMRADAQVEGAAPDEKTPRGADDQAAPRQKPAAGHAESRNRLVGLLNGVTDGVVSVDVDPLGVLVRNYAILDPESPLGKSARGGAHTGADLARLPAGSFVFALSADIAGLGGMQAFLDLAALVPGGEQVPLWLEQNKSLVTSVQMGIYPSKLGVMGGGLLNEAMLWLATGDGAKAKAVLEQWMTSLSGEVNGQKREVTWEKDHALKNGEVADAYAIKDIPLPRNGQSARSKGNPMDRVFRTLLYGPKGPNGFVKSFPDGVYVTFSQRPDVLERATAAATGDKSLEHDAVLTALRGWMMPKPDALAFVGVGSLLNVIRQAANAFPVGGIEIPDAPPNLEPVAFALSVDGGKIEAATMIPTNVIGVAVAAYADRKEAQEEEKNPAPSKNSDDEPSSPAAPSQPPSAKP